MAARKSELVITCNAKGVENVMNFLTERLKGIKQQLQVLNEYGSKNGWTEDMKKDFKELSDEASGIDSIMKRNQETMVKYGQVMQDLANSKFRDVKKALQEGRNALNKMSENDPNRQKLIDDLAKIAREMDIIGGKRRSLTEVGNDLKNLANVKFGTLQRDLESVRKEYELLSDVERQGAKGQGLKNAEKLLEAQIAVTQYGRAGTAPLSAMNDEQLRAEQQRLRSLYSGTEGAKGFEGVSSEALNRLQQANKLIRERADAEREAAKAAKEVERAERERLEFAKQGRQTSRTLANMELASYEELDEALKHLQAQKLKYQSGDTKHIQRNLALQDRLKQKMKEMEQMLLSDEEISRRVNNSKKYNIIQLQQAYDTLKYKLAHTNAEEKTDLLQIRRQMKALAKDINEVKGESTGLMKIWKTAVRNIATYVGVFAGFNMVKAKIQQVAKANLELSDSFARVQKVTALSREEVDALNKSFAKLDTRTSLEDLNELAYSAGKMGLGKYGLEGIEGFVKATNQLQVALGDDLGNSVDESITPLAKLAENLGLIQKMGVEKSMMAIGSSINELSQTTTAVGANIVDFARRVQPAAQMIGLTADQILALGSASDAFGISSEISATAFTKFLASYRTNTAEIEKILSMVPGTLDKFFDEGRTIDGLMAIFQRMHDIGDLRYLEEAFKALGSEGSRMFTTFGAFSKNLDMFREHLATSTKAFQEATSVTREYELMQITAAGILERANNIWEKAFVNPQGVDTVKELAVEWYRFSQELTQSESFMWGAERALKSIAGVVELLITMLPVLIRSMFFYGIAASIRKLKIEWDLMRIAMEGVATTGGKIAAFFKSNIWVLAATALGYAVTYLIDYCSAQKKAVEANEESAKSMDRARQANETYNQTLSSNYGNLMSKYDKLKREWRSLKTEHEKNKWIHDNKSAFDELGLSVNNAATAEEIFNKNTANVIEGFKRRAEAAALAAKMTQLYNQQMDIETEATEKLKTSGKNAGDKVTSNPSGIYTKDATGDTYNQGQYRYDKTTGNYVYTDIGALEHNRRILHGIQQEYDGINKQIDETAARMEELGKKPVVGQTPIKGGGGDGGNGGSGKSEAKQAMRKEMEDMQKQSTGIISKIEEWYRLQEAAINEARADGQLTEDQAAQMVTALSILKNESLSTARRAVTTGETAEWDEMKKNTLPKAMSDMTDLSVNLLKEIQEVPVEVLHKNLSKFNGDPKKVFGLDSRAFFDQMNAKAAGNQREAARLRAKLFGEAEKMLKQYELVEQATDKMQKDLETMGFVTESYEEFARRMQLGIMERPDRNLGLKASRREEIVGSYMSQYGNATPVSNTGDAKQLQDWLNKFTEGGKAKWAVGLPAISDWLKDAEGHLPEIRRFYETLAEIQRTAMQREKQGGNPLTTTTEQNAQFDDLLGRRVSDKEAFSQMGMKFVGQGTIPYRINIENAQEAVEWLRDFATSGKGEMEDWAKAFPDTVGKWMKTLEEQGALDPSKTIGEQEVKSLEDALPQIKAMFYELESYASNIGSTIEKQVQAMTARNPIGIDEMRRQYEQRRQLTEQLYNDEMAKAGENAEAVAELEARKNQALSALDEQWRQEQYQIREQMGWVTLAEQYDNEVAMYQNMLNKKLISEKEFQQKKAQIQMKSGLQQAQMYNQQMSQLVDALRDYEITSTENKYEAMIQAAQANGEDTTKLEEEKEAKILEIKKKYAAAEMMMKIAEIGINTAAGIMQAWVNPGYPGAIPLTVMIAALGAAQTAMAIAEYQKAIGASVSGGAANRKVKLASGMLTYDEGNVQTVVGDDGRVYRAKEQRSLPEGVSMVTEPIATRVNGQAALVGERGPEIVIGRKTTRAIQMNRPDLLRDLALIDRGITTRKVRTFDEGNISDMATAFAGQLPAPQQGQQGSEDSPEMRQTLDSLSQTVSALSATVLQLQKNGIPAKIQKYGTGGLIDEVQSGLKFVSKYK